MLRISTLSLFMLVAGCTGQRAAIVEEPDAGMPADLAMNPDLTIAARLISVAPASVDAGAAALTLTLTGVGFTTESQAVFVAIGTTQRVPLETTFVSSTELTAVVTADLMADGKVWNVTLSPVVVATGTVVTFTVKNPLPVITDVSPALIPAGAPALSLTLTGSGFVPGSKVFWNGGTELTQSATTTPSTKLSALLPASLIVSPSASMVTVVNGAPAGGTSLPKPVQVSACSGTPIVTFISPETAATGATFTLTATGDCFECGGANAVIEVDGVAAATTLGTCTSSKATSASASLTGLLAGNRVITVKNSGGQTSLPKTLAVSDPNPAPVATGLTPQTRAAGQPGFTLTVDGTGFVDLKSVVRWNGASRATTFVSPTRLTASISAMDIASAGMVPVTVFTPAPGGGTSSPLTFDVSGPPSITTLSASSTGTCGVVAGGGAFTLTVNGTNFLAGAKVRILGSDLTANVSSATLLTASVTIAAAPTGNFAQVQVVNPGPSVSAPAILGVAGAATTLAAVQTQVFEASCVYSTCHIGGGTDLPESMDFSTAAGSRASLVGLAATLCPKQRVVRCDPRRESSYLIDKVLAVVAPRACNDDQSDPGTEMPPDQAMSPISAADRQLLIDWVALGAP